MKLPRVRTTLFFAIITILVSSFPVNTQKSFGDTIPITNFLACTTLDQMNCIASVTATLPTGGKVPATLSGNSNSWESKDFQGNVRTYTAQEWRVPGLVNSSGTDTIVTQIWIQNPIVGSNGTDYGALDMTIFGSLWDSPQEKLSSPLCSTSNLVIPCLYPPQLESGVDFTLVINSNLLQPAFTSGSVKDAQVTQSPITGGMQYVISGKPMKIPVNLPDANGTAPGDFAQALDDRYYWHLYIQDIRNPQFDWATNQNCSFGNPVISSNAASAGVPEFDSNSKNVTLQVSSPHMGADGITPEVGQFEASIPLTGIACLWGIPTTELAAEAHVSITYADGTSATATLTTSITKTDFKIQAAGYHYSSPTIHFTFAGNTSQSQSSQTLLAHAPIVSTRPSKVTQKQSASKSITCQKGNIKKKLLGTRCPNGYHQVAS